MHIIILLQDLYVKKIGHQTISELYIYTGSHDDLYDISISKNEKVSIIIL